MYVARAWLIWRRKVIQVGNSQAGTDPIGLVQRRVLRESEAISIDWNDDLRANLQLATIAAEHANPSCCQRRQPGHRRGFGHWYSEGLAIESSDLRPRAELIAKVRTASLCGNTP